MSDFKLKRNDDQTILVTDKRGSSVAMFEPNGTEPEWHQKISDTKKEAVIAQVGFFIADGEFAKEKQMTKAGESGDCRRCGKDRHRGRCKGSTNAKKGKTVARVPQVVRPSTVAPFNVEITPLLNPVERIEGRVVLAGGFVFQGVVDITAEGMKLDGVLKHG